MSSTFCQICGRQLTDASSVANGVGPECATKRAGFLAGCGTTEAEITSLETANPNAARWIRNFRADMRAGRARQARQCLDAARHQAMAGQSVATVAAVASVPTSVSALVATVNEQLTPAIVVRPPDCGFRVHPPKSMRS